MSLIGVMSGARIQIQIAGTFKNITVSLVSLKVVYCSAGTCSQKSKCHTTKCLVLAQLFKNQWPSPKRQPNFASEKNCKSTVRLCHMKTASWVSKANEQQSASPSSRHLDELVENQDDPEERSKTGPERSELGSTGLASIQQRKLRTKMVSLITD